MTTALEILVVCLSSADVAMILLAPFDDELLRVGLRTSKYERTRIKRANKRAKTRHRELGDGNSHMTRSNRNRIRFEHPYLLYCYTWRRKWTFFCLELIKLFRTARNDPEQRPRVVDKVHFHYDFIIIGKFLVSICLFVLFIHGHSQWT